MHTVETRRWRRYLALTAVLAVTLLVMWAYRGQMVDIHQMR
ncbi:MAG TPA: hypothetical protein VF062_26880 [Candidatus Limnocylindrales bacterium]